jgi:hypothetical protein
MMIRQHKVAWLMNPESKANSVYDGHRFGEENGIGV